MSVIITNTTNTLVIVRFIGTLEDLILNTHESKTIKGGKISSMYLFANEKWHGPFDFIPFSELYICNEKLGSDFTIGPKKV